MSTRTPHDFGGNWTSDKLDRIRKYLHAYTIIFTRNPRARMLQTTFVDAFAGTGYRTLMQRHGSLFEDLAAEEAQEYLKGSARIALEVEPSFNHYLFIERNPERADELEQLKKDFPAKATRIRIENAEANDFLIKWCRETDWGRNRAVVFLDPYGMQVEWPLIKAIAETHAIDLWILFPLGMAVSRLLTRSQPPPEEWGHRLTLFFGTEEWRQEFYPIQHVQTLFGEEDIQSRRADFDRIGRFFVRRLRTVFTAVADNPLPLMNSRNVPLYLLCFAVGNPQGARSALRIAQDILGR